jgi:hypothetical protein
VQAGVPLGAARLICELLISCVGAVPRQLNYLLSLPTDSLNGLKTHLYQWRGGLSSRVADVFSCLTLNELSDSKANLLFSFSRGYGFDSQLFLVSHSTCWQMLEWLLPIYHSQ